MWNVFVTIHLLPTRFDRRKLNWILSDLLVNNLISSDYEGSLKRAL